MEYITIKQAADFWAIKERQIQTLCKDGRIDGAVRFGRTWAIPQGAPKPMDRRRTPTSQDTAASLQGTGFWECASPELRQLLDKFPLKINVADKHGLMVYANDAFFEKTLEQAKQDALGAYNIFEEEALEAWGLKAHILKAFQGEYVVTRNLKFPNRDLAGVRYGKDFAFTTIFNDIYSYPIVDQQNELIYVVSVFIPVRTYEAREEVSRAKDYIEAHWAEPFQNAQLAKAVKLSASNLLRVFKMDTGFTPREYYMDVKLRRLMGKLQETNAPIAQVFSECDLDYNSYYLKLFRKLTGMSPTQFRKVNR